ncbi:MAG: secretin [Gammaproteobacteria bacterium]
MRHAVAIAWLLAALAAGTAYAAAMTMQVVQLRHRSAESLIPVLKPLAVPGAAVTGTGSQLILRTTARNMADLMTVIAELDRAPRRLMITVRQDVDSSAAGMAAGLDGRYRSGDGSGVAVRSLHTRTTADERGEYRVQALEGTPAWIDTGTSVPLAGRGVYTDGVGTVVQDTIDYRDVGSGFYAVPRLSGDSVTLEIRPRQSRLAPEGGGAIDYAEAGTTVAGRLGEWISISAAGDAGARVDGTLGAATRIHGAVQRSLWVRVDELR